MSSTAPLVRVTMAEIAEASSTVSSDDDSVLSGSACYSSDSNVEDEVSLSQLSGISTHTDVHPYLFEPELSPSKTPSGASLVEESISSGNRVGNTDW